MLAYITGTVDQELLLRNEYLAAENRILKAQIKGRLLLSEADKATLAEIAHRLGRKALEEVAAAAMPDTILGWYRKLIANKFDGSRFRHSAGRPRVDEETEGLVVQMAKENPTWGYDRIVGALANLGQRLSDQTVGNIPGPHQGERGFFSVRGGDSYSQLALLHVKNRIGEIALREGRFIPFQVKSRPAHTGLREEGLGIKKRISISWLRLGRLKPGRLCNFACGGFCGSYRISRWNPFAGTALAAGWIGASAHFIPPKGQRPYTFRLYFSKETEDVRFWPLTPATLRRTSVCPSSRIASAPKCQSPT
jgi:hypothetical protein